MIHKVIGGEQKIWISILWLFLIPATVLLVVESIKDVSYTVRYIMLAVVALSAYLSRVWWRTRNLEASPQGLNIIGPLGRKEIIARENIVSIEIRKQKNGLKRYLRILIKDKPYQYFMMWVPENLEILQRDLESSKMPFSITEKSMIVTVNREWPL